MKMVARWWCGGSGADDDVGLMEMMLMMVWLMWCSCGKVGRVTLVGDKVDQSGSSRGCDVVDMTTREMVMRVACDCNGDEGGGFRSVRLGSAGSWLENSDGAEKRGERRCMC
ncbi:hypothetical protein Tco_1253803 [Tanacetum coccineum]